MPIFPNIYHKDNMTNYKDQVRCSASSNYAGDACDKNFNMKYEYK